MQSKQRDQQWAPGDVYFGDPDNPLPDWRGEASESDINDDEPPSEEDRRAVAAILGFDPSEISDSPPTS